MRMENKIRISKELGRKHDSVLAFVREVQEIGEKIEEGTILKDLIEIHKIRGKGTYEGIDELENVKEHRFVNHSKEYAKDDVHVNTAENRQHA